MYSLIVGVPLEQIVYIKHSTHEYEVYNKKGIKTGKCQKCTVCELTVDGKTYSYEGEPSYEVLMDIMKLDDRGYLDYYQGCEESLTKGVIIGKTICEKYSNGNAFELKEVAKDIDKMKFVVENMIEKMYGKKLRVKLYMWSYDT
uniref:Uncharacterized protein n=1 Tax=Pithovirus LCPAC001 TaxID=2506585 RepID=A0A481Z1G6_9VIRU|nr:MAG: hypothetical protein LCPAC001_00670 [Pithovirus LCPAC001]